MVDSSSVLDLGFVEDGRQARVAAERRRTKLSFLAPAIITLTWFIAVTLFGLFDRVAEHGVAATTMVVGGFVAGSTPQGGGAVAFPVFTKALEVPAETARSFSLCIQAIGMSSAAIAIIASRRAVAWRAIAIAAPCAIAGFLATLLLFGDPGQPFWPSTLPGPYVKVTFTLVVAAMAWGVFLGIRIPIRRVRDTVPPIDRRIGAGLVTCGTLGGVASALVGSGADVFMYTVVVILLGVRSGVGVPTSVITMAITSVVGFVVLGLIDGQLFVELSDQGLVSSVGGHVFEQARPLRQADLFGMWLAAVPIVAWGAPLGAWIAGRMNARTLVGLALLVAVAEIVSTIIFLGELRTDATLAIYAVVGTVVALVGISTLAGRRRDLFSLAEVDWSAAITRTSVEVTPNYRRDIEGDSP